MSLFHVSADMRWSDLPMSGSFVEMLRRIVDMFRLHVHAGRGRRQRSEGGNGGAAAHARRFRRVRTAALDGQAAAGRLPGSGDVDHPPGFYGPADGPLAVNALAAADRIAPLDTSSLRARRASYTNAEPRDLRGILLSAALALFLIDAVIVALLGAGIAALLRRRAAPAALAFAFLLSAMLAVPSPSRADDNDDFASRRSRKPGWPMSSPAMPTSIPSSRRAWPD